MVSGVEQLRELRKYQQLQGELTQRILGSAVGRNLEWDVMTAHLELVVGEDTDVIFFICVIEFNAVSCALAILQIVC